MAIRMVALDLDGTLLDSEKNISMRNRQAILRAMERGIEVVIGSGRVITECAEILQMVPQFRYAVTVSGACILDLKEKRTIFSDGFTAEQAGEIYAILSRFDCLIDFGAGGWFHNDREKLLHADRYTGKTWIAEWLRTTHKWEDSLDAFVADWNGQVEKIHAYFGRTAERDAALSALRVLPYELAGSAEVDLEVMKSGVDKGVALGKLAAHLGIRREEVLAAGDSGNDEKMLAWAGVSVAMGNACEELKRKADLIAPGNDEDGVAWLLDEIVEGRI